MASSAPASRKASVAPSIRPDETPDSPTQQPTRQQTVASPAPEGEVTVVETPVGTGDTTEIVVMQEQPSGGEASGTQTSSSQTAPSTRANTMPPPSKAPTRQGTTQFIIGDVSTARPQATVVSDHTSSASSLPPSRLVLAEQPPLKAWPIKESIKSAKMAMSNNSNKVTPAASMRAIHEHTPSSSSDWEQPSQLFQVAAPPKTKFEAERYEGDPWVHGIFGCFNDPGTCCLGTFLPCVLYSKTDHRMKVDPTLENWKGLDGPCLLSCCVITCVGPIGWPILSFIQRNEVQKRFKLRSDLLTDIAFSFILPCCTMVQAHNEARDQFELQNNGRKEQYSNANARMTYARGGTSSTSI